MFDGLWYEFVFYIQRVKHLIAIVLIIFALIFWGAYSAHGEPIRAASYIGLCSPYFPCSRAIRAMPKDAVAFGYLNETFGRECPCLERIHRTREVQYVRVHVVNGTCFPDRGRKCAKGEFFYGLTHREAAKLLANKDPALLRRYRKNLRRAQKANAWTEGKLSYSICLECQLPNSARRVLLATAMRTLKKDAGSFVDSPMGFHCLRNTICERHGITPRFSRGQQCVVDNDGQELTPENVSGYLNSSKRCESQFFWTKGFNLIPPGKSKFILPRERIHGATLWDFARLKRFLLRRSPS